MAEEPRTTKITVDCLDCGAEINLVGKIRVGQPVTCSECGTTLEVMALDPIELDWIYDEPEYDDGEEDW